MSEPTYLTQTWSGLDFYVCLACTHSEFDLDRMTTHLQTIHGALPTPDTEEAMQAEADRATSEMPAAAEGSEA